MICFCDFRFQHFLLISVRKGILDSGEIQNLASRIKDELEEWGEGSLALLTSAAALSYRGFIKDVKHVHLLDENMSTVPTQHLVSLTSRVTGRFDQDHDVDGCDLVTILDNLQCTEIGLGFNGLGEEEEAQALVRAMESRVERLYFHDTRNMCVNTGALTEYSGQGRCKFIFCEDVDDVNFIKKLFCWVNEKGWYCYTWDEYEGDYRPNFSFTLKKKEEHTIIPLTFPCQLT